MLWKQQALLLKRMKDTSLLKKNFRLLLYGFYKGCQSWSDHSCVFGIFVFFLRTYFPAFHYFIKKTGSWKEKKRLHYVLPGCTRTNIIIIINFTHQSERGQQVEASSGTCKDCSIWTESINEWMNERTNQPISREKKGWWQTAGFWLFYDKSKEFFNFRTVYVYSPKRCCFFISTFNSTLNFKHRQSR